MSNVENGFKITPSLPQWGGVGEVRPFSSEDTAFGKKPADSEDIGAKLSGASKEKPSAIKELSAKKQLLTKLINIKQEREINILNQKHDPNASSTDKYIKKDLEFQDKEDQIEAEIAELDMFFNTYFGTSSADETPDIN